MAAAHVAGAAALRVRPDMAADDVAALLMEMADRCSEPGRANAERQLRRCSGVATDGGELMHRIGVLGSKYS